MDITLLKHTDLGDLVVELGFFCEWYPITKKAYLMPEYKLYESIFVEIDKDVFHKNRNIMIGVIYRYEAV